MPGIGGKIRKAHCFKVTGIYSAWLLCAENSQQIYDFRWKLLIAAIKSYLRYQGILNVNVLLPTENLGEWTWREQKDWPGVCQTGVAQSPIDVDPGRAEDVSYMNLRFVFKAANDAVLKFDGHENEVYGDFGKFIHKLEIGNRNCLTYKMKFKFVAEHAWMGVQNDAELQVYCMTSDGSYGVVSFFFIADLEDAAESNKFIDTLSLEKWQFNIDDDGAGQGIPIGLPPSKKAKKTDGNNNAPGGGNTGSKGKNDGQGTPRAFESELFSDLGPNLNLLITNSKDGVLYSFKDIFRRSFAWYTGSMATPPCKEGVQHFVMEQAIYVPKIQLMTLREKTYPEGIEPNGNNRKFKPQGTTKVYTHTDYGTKCADTPETPFADEEIAKPENKALELDLTGIRATFLKASNIVTSYGYTGMPIAPQITDGLLDTHTEGGRQTIALSEIKPEAVPRDIKVKLLKKANEVIKGINDKDKAIDDLLEQDEAIKVPYFD